MRLKLPQLNNPQVIFLVLIAVVSLAFYNNRSVLFKNKQIGIPESVSTPTPTPTPSPRPLTFAEMSTLYGPCVSLPTLMYHHVQTKESAEAKKQTSLSVYTDIFKSQMQYLKDKGYNTLSMTDLVSFFDSGVAIPKHSVLITFDDGYEDFYTDAFPILRDLGFKATVFTPTGLINNPDYLIWEQIASMNRSVLFANHTWSHKNVGVSESIMQYEISTADTQLTERGLNSPKVFAYPYGFDSGQAQLYLSSLGYKAAFSTTPGNILCLKRRFDLPRVRIGNIPLSSYGF